jgi:polygalacturonase
MKHMSMVLIWGLACASGQAADAERNAPQPDPATSFVLPAVKVPAFPEARVSIADHGAVPDGKTLNTEAFARAIDTLAARGGGRVIVPPGMWLTGPIRLRSRIDLHLEEGAVVVFTGDLDPYREGDGVVRGLISGKDLEDVAISGPGLVEGAGHHWRPVKEFKMTDKQWDALLDGGGVLTEDKEIWWPSAEHQRIRRPRLVRLDDCKRVLLDQATFLNSPQFGLDLSDCEDVTIRDVTVRNAWYAQNGDGIDLHSCRNVHILRARVDVGDDALCMKSNRGRPLENVLIEGCTVYHGHGGFVIGSEELGGMRNLRVRDCRFFGTDVGIRFKSARDRGGLVTNLDIRNILMIDIREEAILFDMHYQDDLSLDKDGRVARAPDAGIPDVNDTTPRFRNIAIRDVICRGAERAVLLAGLPEMAVERIRLENVSITARTGMVCMDARDIQLRQVEIINQDGPALHVYQTRGLDVDDFRFRDGLETPVRLQGTGNQDLRFPGLPDDALHTGL